MMTGGRRSADAVARCVLRRSDRCICRGVPFAELLPRARAAGWTLADLIRETGCGGQCGLCRPYLRRMLPPARPSSTSSCPERLTSRSEVLVRRAAARARAPLAAVLGWTRRRASPSASVWLGLWLLPPGRCGRAAAHLGGHAPDPGDLSPHAASCPRRRRSRSAPPCRGRPAQPRAGAAPPPGRHPARRHRSRRPGQGGGPGGGRPARGRERRGHPGGGGGTLPASDRRHRAAAAGAGGCSSRWTSRSWAGPSRRTRRWSRTTWTPTRAATRRPSCR